MDEFIKKVLDSISPIKRELLGLDGVFSAHSMADALYSMGVSSLSTKGKLPFPAAFIFDSEYCLIIDATNFMESPEEKRILGKLLRKVASNEKIIGIGVMFEGMALHVTRDELNKLESLDDIEQDPDVLETLTVFCEWHTGEDFSRSGIIIRDEKDKIIDITEMNFPLVRDGIFSNLFVQPAKPNEFLN